MGNRSLNNSAQRLNGVANTKFYKGEGGDLTDII
jgi:hypothetical protein